MRNRVRQVQTTLNGPIQDWIEVENNQISPSTQLSGSRTSRVRLLWYQTFYGNHSSLTSFQNMFWTHCNAFGERPPLEEGFFLHGKPSHPQSKTRFTCSLYLHLNDSKDPKHARPEGHPSSCHNQIQKLSISAVFKHQTQQSLLIRNVSHSGKTNRMKTH